MEFTHGDDRLSVEIVGAAQARVDGVTYDVRTFDDGTSVVSRAPEAGERPLPSQLAWTAVDGETRWVFVDGSVYELSAAQAPRRRRGATQDALAAPMPATVRRINVAVGDTVAAGDTLLVLEAMKMELPIRAGAAGTITSVACREGELVQPGVALVEIAPADAP
jgi:acetyl-CoA/propionyl-CoA carboxylase biotin carboxyl carrier protein